MPIVGAVSLYVSLLTFTLRVHPDRLDYVDQVLVSSILFGEKKFGLVVGVKSMPALMPLTAIIPMHRA